VGAHLVDDEKYIVRTLFFSLLPNATGSIRVSSFFRLSEPESGSWLAEFLIQMIIARQVLLMVELLSCLLQPRCLTFSTPPSRHRDTH